MSVKRERPNQGVPGELHTPSGQKLRVTLPPELQPPTDVGETTAKKPRPEEAPDPRPSQFRDAPYGAA